LDIYVFNYVRKREKTRKKEIIIKETLPITDL